MARNKKRLPQARHNNTNAGNKDTIGMTLEEMIELAQTREQQNEKQYPDI